MKNARAELALVGVTIIWGTTFVVVKSALAEVSTWLFLALRFTLAALALLLIYRRAMRRGSLGAGILAGVALFTAYVFQTLGLELTTPSKSAFITGLSIPMVPLLGSLVYRIRPRFLEVAGVLIASFGMALITICSANVRAHSRVRKSPLLISNLPGGNVIRAIPNEAISTPATSKNRGLIL